MYLGQGSLFGYAEFPDKVTDFEGGGRQRSFNRSSLKLPDSDVLDTREFTVHVLQYI